VRTSDFDYDLPDELIAQEPAFPRDSCRMMVLDRTTGAISHERFSDIIDHLVPGDLLVANETRVMPARLLGHKAGTGGAVEALLLHAMDDEGASPSDGGTSSDGGSEAVWECLVKPGKRLRPGAVVEFRSRGTEDLSAPVLLRGTVLDITGTAGERAVRFEALEGTVDAAFHACGNVPLPPYITRYGGDPEMYQTVFSRSEHSAAAPTAGLHFTPELIEAIRAKGIDWETVELEVGLDTFRVITEEDPTQHTMHTERYHVSQRVIDRIEATKAAGHRVVAVGTTSVRSLESAWSVEEGRMLPREGESTSLYILPGFEFHVVDAMITNFHVPRSTLMMLVSAFAGYDHIMAAYAEAVRQRYRMLSFGDAMFME